MFKCYYNDQKPIDTISFCEQIITLSKETQKKTFYELLIKNKNITKELINAVKNVYLNGIDPSCSMMEENRIESKWREAINKILTLVVLYLFNINNILLIFYYLLFNLFYFKTKNKFYYYFLSAKINFADIKLILKNIIFAIIVTDDIFYNEKISYQDQLFYALNTFKIV